MIPKLLRDAYPQAFVKFERPTIGPTTSAKIEARFSGPDPEVLREIGGRVMAIFDAEADAINVRHDWYERSKVLRPVYDEAAARRLGISQSDIDQALAMNVQGLQIGTYRAGSEVLPIILRPPAHERSGVSKLEEVQVYSPGNGVYVDIGQFVREIRVEWEDRLIKRLDRKRTLAVLADPGPGSLPPLPRTLFPRLYPEAGHVTRARRSLRRRSDLPQIAGALPR